MADVTSSDGKVTVRVHTAWASVLVWTTMTGNRTVLRNGQPIGTFPSGAVAFYDHYPPLGVPSSYAVTDGTTTSAAATVTVAIDPRYYTWIKSAVDPNLSLALPVRRRTTVGRDNNVGLFPIIGSSTYFARFGGMRGRQMSVLVKVTGDQQAKLEQMLALGPALWQWHARDGKDPMWAATTKVSEQDFYSGPAKLWTDVTLDLVETSAPTLSGNIIPGWGWDDVKAMYATSDALKADNATVLDLILRGVSEGAAGAVTAVDNGDGTITYSGPGTTVNGDGTFTLAGITPAGDGTFAA